MKALKYKLYLLIVMVFFSTSTLAAGGKQQPPAKANVEKFQQSATSAFSWFNRFLIKK